MDGISDIFLHYGAILLVVLAIGPGAYYLRKFLQRMFRS